jgi:putative ABC transport system permease protein
MIRAESLDQLSRSLRHAARSLVRRPLLAVVGLITLGLGIGANTAMFSIINVVFLRPLPFHDPDRLVMAWSSMPDQALSEGFSSYLDFKDWREQSKSFDGLAALWTFPNGDVNLTGGAEPQRVSVARITPDFFSVLGIRPLYGRAFQEEESILGNHRRAILSYGLWHDQLGADSTLVGRSLQVNGVPYTVVGIMPRDLQTRAVHVLGTDVQMWRPLVPEDNQTGGRGSRKFRVVGRLRPGVTLAQAQSDLASIAGRLAEASPETNSNVGARLVRLREQIVKDVQRGLLFLSAAVALVLLGACANVANLLLIKAATNRKQLAVQRALGASRVRLGLQVLAEALLLGGAGAAFGLLLAFGIVRAFVAFGPADIPLLADARIDLTVLAFTVLATLVAVLLASLLPGWRAAQPDDAILLRQSVSRVRGRDDRRTMKALSVGQIALAMLVLVVGGLLIRSFDSLLRVNPGVESRGVLTFQLELPMAATAPYPTQPHRDVFFETLVQRVGALSEVGGVTIASAPPLEEEPSQSSLRLRDDPPETFRQASFRMVSPSYFGLLGIPILRGRSLEFTDGREAPAVVVVSDALARSVWGAESPIGKRIVLSAGRDAEVVGVAGNVRSGGLDAEAGRTVYMPTTQGAFNFMTVMVKTAKDPSSLVPTIRRVVRALDSAVPLHHVRTLDAIASTSVAHQRFQMLLVSAFAALMLALAVVGTYGVTAYGVSERTNEMGIRAALGATADDIRRLVVGEGIRLAVYGILIGAIAALALSGVLSRFLFGIRALDWATFLIVPALLAATMLAATLLPAYRASRVDPMRALRSE